MPANPYDGIGYNQPATPTPSATYPYGQQDYGNASQALGQSSNLYNNSAASYDNAAARVRNRVNAQGNAVSQDISNKFQQRGLGNSGLQQRAVQRNNQNTQQAYAGGLVDLEKNFSDQNIQRAQGLSQVGNQYANMGQARDSFGTAYRGQDIQQLLGLGEQALTQRGQDLSQILGLRGQDLNQESTLRGQDIQNELGKASSLRDLMGVMYQYGNTNLGVDKNAQMAAALAKLLQFGGA